MELSEQDYELLSAYVDGELSADERTALELRLQSDAELRRELNALRQTVALVKQLPRATAPRDFRLTPEMVADVKRPQTEARTPITPTLPAAPRRSGVVLRLVPVLSAAAGFVLMLLGAVALLDTQGGPQAANVAMQAVEETQAFSFEAESDQFDAEAATLMDLTPVDEAIEISPEIMMVPQGTAPPVPESAEMGDDATGAAAAGAAEMADAAMDKATMDEEPASAEAEVAMDAVVAGMTEPPMLTTATLSIAGTLAPVEARSALPGTPSPLPTLIPTQRFVVTVEGEPVQEMAIGAESGATLSARATVIARAPAAPMETTFAVVDDPVRQTSALGPLLIAVGGLLLAASVVLLANRRR